MIAQLSVKQIENLPVLPQVAMRVTERMQSPTATLHEISELIRSDIGLSTKVLRLANSSYYSIPGGVTEIQKALQYLGFNTIAQIVLTSSVFGAFKTQGVREFPLSQFWIHSFAVGQIAEIAARSLQLKNPSDAFIGGLMHDIGKLILLELNPEQLTKIVHHANEHQVSFIAAEEALGFQNHIELGIVLARHWGLPDALISGIMYHHGGGKDLNAQVIEWANLWINFHRIGNSGSHAADFETSLQTSSQHLHLDGKRLASIEALFQKEFEKAGAILSGN